MNNRIPANVIRENIVKRRSGTIVSPVLGIQEKDQIPVRTFEQANFQQFNFSGSIYLPADRSRIYLMIQNQGGTVMLIDFTGVSGSPTVGLQLPGSVFAYYEPLVAPTSAVNIAGVGFALTGSL